MTPADATCEVYPVKHIGERAPHHGWAGLGHHCLTCVSQQPRRAAIMDRIITERRGHILVVTINRPEARNTFDSISAQGMHAAMDLLDVEDDLFVGVITGHESRQEVEAFLAKEPYTRAGLFESVSIESFDRFVPHADPQFLEKLLVAARDWIARSGLMHR